MELTGKIALITGATGGIGGATARLLASRGAQVIASGRDPQRGASLVKEIVEAGGVARFVSADLTEVESLRKLAAAAGDVDVLVNNAALFPIAPTAEQTVAGLDEAFAANVRAPYLLTATLAPAMVAKGAGSIINVSTMAARVGMPGLSTYSATKGALEALTRTWAAEFSPAGVRVNTVSPGPTRTDMVMTAMGEEGAAQVASTTLLKRLAAPGEIAEVIAFLASDRSGFMTGATVAVDAGRTAA
ncbi:SDR family oxidoreductase [Paractinoplanes ferrugineus]|uniref:SDR family NAD(P)-dependent oxidoreductase n=1 Tax=Paractinoplanes ferrugineus TaxID=113564 RepID=UPI001943A192|nr:SDR family oxidoreductase [Actinoplanes ferrugineus]